jgi:hypothetical protein
VSRFVGLAALVAVLVISLVGSVVLGKTLGSEPARLTPDMTAQELDRALEGLTLLAEQVVGETAEGESVTQRIYANTDEGWVIEVIIVGPKQPMTPPPMPSGAGPAPVA